MSLIFCQTPLPTLGLADLERLKRNDLCYEHSSSFSLDCIIFVLADNKDSYKILDGFEMWQDKTRVCDVSYPCMSEKFPYSYNGINAMSTLVRSFLNGSSAFLQVTRISITAWMSLHFCQIQSPITE